MKYRSFIVITLSLIICFMAFSIPAAAEDKTEKTSNDKQQEKDIQPQPGENWYLPGDEEVYKVKIDPITPAEGINTGAPGETSPGIVGRAALCRKACAVRWRRQ